MTTLPRCKNHLCRFCLKPDYDYLAGLYSGTCAFKEIMLNLEGKCENQEVVKEEKVQEDEEMANIHREAKEFCDDLELLNKKECEKLAHHDFRDKDEN